MNSSLPPYLLSIDTSTKAGSVALFKDGYLLSNISCLSGNSHARNLNAMIEYNLNLAQIEMSALSAVAISEGPGSFTGLRIGYTAAKAICALVKCPLLSISTLEAMAFEVSKECAANSLLLPILDARRMEVYVAGYTNELQPIFLPEAHILTEFSFLEYAESYHQILFFGENAEKAKPVLKHQKFKFTRIGKPSAENVGSLAVANWNEILPSDLVNSEPFYLKGANITRKADH